jgi:tRNA G18 (ribose-2'-O)-methylase SpoU
VAPVEHVSNPSDERVAGYVGLTDAQLRARRESATGLFIVEGHTALARAVTSPYPLRSVLCLPGRLAVVQAALGDTDVPVYVAERDVLAATAGFDVHRGVLALAERGAPRAIDAVLDGARTIVILEGLSDQENVGAIVRSARAFGVDALLLDPTAADPLGRRSVRVSMGEVLHLPWARATPWPDALRALADGGWRVLALTPAADARSLRTVSRAPGDRVAVLLGAEGPGLSAAAMARAERVCIPIRPGVDSLNVGHATAVALWHVSEP